MGDDSRGFDIKYMPRTSIKGQVLADLVAELLNLQRRWKWEMDRWMKDR